MLTFISFLWSALCVFSVLAVPNPQTLGVQIASTPNALPTLTLPYGTWRAASYDSVNDIYTFKNIRFAAPPTGNLRWAKPAPPAINHTLQDGTYGNACPQGTPPGAPGMSKLILLRLGLTGGAEDCLFLDLYVPGCAIKNPLASLPVTVWTYGGAYIFGSKDQGFPGNGPIAISGNKMIFMTYNYRVGSFGFLAGTTMEKEGLPNAGFYDQRAAFQWVQKYISLVGGDPNQVTAWGESAGAGSILHHITAFGGKQDPLFRKVVMQSIASEIFVDRRGEVESFYQEFLNASGCAAQTIACLRAAPFATLNTANQEVISNVSPSAFKPGPAADGAWVRQMPALELASGNYFAGITSLILSHVSNEGFVFVDGEIQTDAAFANLVDFIIPSYAPTIRTDVVNFYPSPNTPGSPYATQNDRTIQYLDDTNFLCNLRYLNNVFQGKTWTMEYSIPPGYHSTDLTPTFYNGTGAPSPTLDAIYRDYQSYLVSLSTSGNPNTHRNTTNVPATINWPHTTGVSSEDLGNVLNVGPNGFTLETDPEPLKSHCDFFLNVQAAVTLAGGYVPPGGAVPNNLGVTNPNPSANYTTH